tara:strand:+ start:2922 stop:3116 length:195 start_codon:yes stop_codon:yes gene_type:complete
MTAWTEHIKATAKKNGTSYKEAMKVASSSYKKPEAKVVKTKKPKPATHKMPDGTIMAGKKHPKE